MGRNEPGGQGIESRVLAMLWLGLLAVGLAGCGSTPAATSVPPTRTPKPTFTAAVQLLTPTPSCTHTLMPTFTTLPSPSPTATPTIDPHLNPLTGETVTDPAVLQRRPLLVRIGNDAPVRPQSGLSAADMVYEEAMDGWTLTRFTAIVWSGDPAELRPVRSARLFTIELGHMFDGALVHSGANDQVRWLLSQSGLTDLDEYFHPKPYHWLDPQGAWKAYPWMGRVATGSEELRSYLQEKGLEKAVRLPGFQFSAPGTPAPTGEPASYVRIPFPERASVEFRYDAQRQLYRRYVQGQPHLDAESNEQLTAANVIVHYMVYEETDVKDVNGVPTFNIISTGEGRAQVFRDGVAIEARWIRPEVEDFVQYVYLDGTVVLFHVGQSWVEVVPPEYVVAFGTE